MLGPTVWGAGTSCLRRELCCQGRGLLRQQALTPQHLGNSLFRTVQLGKGPLGDEAQGFLRPQDLVVAGSEGSEQGPGAGPDCLRRQTAVLIWPSLE